MDEMTRFEAQIEERLRAFARTGVRSVDSAEVARAVSVRHPKPAAPSPAARQLGGEGHRTRQRAVLGPWRTRSRTTFAAAAVVAMLALGVALFAVAGGPRPTPIEKPSPSLPGIVAPSSAPSGPSAAPTALPVTNPAGVWIATGTMGTPRYVDTAVRLLDGRVLVLGGSSGDGSDVTSAELYDPVTGTWSATGSMIRPIGFPPTLLLDGRVLAGDALDGGRPGAELYDPNTGTWSATGQMVRVADFVGDSATLLRDGKVLVTGMSAGDPLGSCEANGPPCRGGGAEMYDPGSGRWTATGRMITPRYYATATLLPDGKVLVAGGYVIPDVVTDVAELYDPSTGSWTAIANMPARFGHHTATLLRDGTVLVSGWIGEQFEMATYDAATGTWTALPARTDVNYATATLLSDGRVLMANDAFDSVGAELYDPGTGSWTTVAPMLRSHGPLAILLLDGTVLMAGGGDCLDGVCVATASAELYVPAGVAPPPLPVFPTPPSPVIPTPTPRPTPLPPQAGPVPPNARPWTVTVVNESSGPATLFLAEHFNNGIAQLCGSVTPNVVPAGVTVDVIFQLPPKSVRGCWLIVNAIPGDEGGFFETSDAPTAGKVWLRSDGEVAWLGP